MRRELVGDHADLDVVAVGQAKVLLRRDIAEHGGAERADHGSTDRRRDVIVTGCDVGRQRPQCVERGLASMGQLLIHVLFDLVHRDVARPFDHDLAVMLPGNLGQLAQRLEFCELRGVVGVADPAGAQSVSQREADVTSPSSADQSSRYIFTRIWESFGIRASDSGRRTRPRRFCRRCGCTC